MPCYRKPPETRRGSYPVSCAGRELLTKAWGQQIWTKHNARGPFIPDLKPLTPTSPLRRSMLTSFALLSDGA